MGSQVLILTDDPSVEQSLGDCLHGMDGVSPIFAGECEDGLYIARTSRPQWMIVDAELAKNGLPGFLDSLRAEAGGGKVLLLYPKERKTELPWLDLSVSASLAKPFTKSEFLRSFNAFATSTRPTLQSHDRPTVPRSDDKPSLADHSYPWLHDKNQADVVLERQLESHPVQSALLFRLGELWASSSKLGDHSGQTSLSELLDYCRRIGIMQKVSKGDLVRYIRLKSFNRPLLLYATRLTDEYNLALILDAKTNFRDVRTLAKRFAADLLQAPDLESKREHDLGDRSDQMSTQRQSSAGSGDDEDLPVPKLSLGAVPEPTPASMRHAVPSNPHVREKWMEYDALQKQVETSPERGWPPVEVEVDAGMQGTGTPFHVADSDLRQIVSSSRRDIQIAEMPGLPEAYEVIQSQTGQEQKFVMRVLSPAIYTLQYACLLLPRLPDHLLAGDLSLRLTYWLPRLMMAFGWRLERLAMQVDYLHWIVSVPPEASAEYVLERTRIHTSEQIFQEFPRLKLDNPSGDFWAPGYLVMTGTAPLPEKIVRQYIAHTRHRQGFSGDWQ